MDDIKKRWMLITKTKCKSCGRSGQESVEIKGCKVFRSCKCGWIVRVNEGK